MRTRYVNFRAYARGVKRENGQGIKCVSCKTIDATQTADRVQGKFRLHVALCDIDADIAHEMNAHA